MTYERRPRVSEPPAIECERCEKKPERGNRIATTEERTVCRGCATEKEIEEWESYVAEREARETAAQERARRDRGHGL